MISQKLTANVYNLDVPHYDTRHGRVCSASADEDNGGQVLARFRAGQ